MGEPSPVTQTHTGLCEYGVERPIRVDLYSRAGCRKAQLILLGSINGCPGLVSRRTRKAQLSLRSR
jgi:hypothetical protein